MDIRHLRTFKTISELNSFYQAAHELGYVPSTVTSHIKIIEEELNISLFDRLGKNIYLTDAGKLLLPYANNILSLYEQSKEVVMEDNIESINLRVGTTESFNIYQLPSIIYTLRKKIPNINLQFKITNGENLREYLRKGEIDLAILLEIEREEEKDFTIKKIASEPMVLIEPNESILNDINNRTVLFTGEGCDYRFLFEDYLKENGVQTNIVYELGSIEAIKRFVGNGLGISLLPLMSVKEEIKMDKFKAILWNSNNLQIATFLAFHKNKWISPSMQTFIDVIHNNIKQSKLDDY